MAFFRVPRAVPRLIVPVVLVYLLWTFYAPDAWRADVDMRWSRPNQAGQDNRAQPKAAPPKEKLDSTFGCEMNQLKQPLRSVTVQGGVNGLVRYTLFLHAPLLDKHISEALWISKGAEFMEDTYQEVFSIAIETVQQLTGRQRLTIMDLGANIGLHAYFFAKVGSKRTKFLIYVVAVS